MKNDWDAVIIGGGVAGLSAAQMLGRSLRRTLVIDGGMPRNRFAAHMHGVLGHDGTPPTRLLDTGRAEARAYGVEFAQGTVAAIADEGELLRVTREDGSADTTRAVVITTGIRDDLPDVPGLSEQWGRTVLHCPYCHGWEVAGRRLAVLAMSAAGLHQVELVRQLSDDVTVFAAEAFDDEAIARLSARDIRIVQAPVRKVSGRDGALIVTTDDAEHVVDAMFTGGSPVLDLAFAAGLQLARADGPGGPLVADLRGATSHPRVFAAGNVTAPFGNVPLSMGAGSMAGAGVNAMLVAEDFTRAMTQRAGLRVG